MLNGGGGERDVEDGRGCGGERDGGGGRVAVGVSVHLEGVAEWDVRSGGVGGV